MLEYLAGRPTAYLDEVRDLILDEFSVALDISTIWRMLKRRKWSRKQAEKRALERSEINEATMYLLPARATCP